MLKSHYLQQLKNLDEREAQIDGHAIYYDGFEVPKGATKPRPLVVTYREYFIRQRKILNNNLHLATTAQMRRNSGV